MKKILIIFIVFALLLPAVSLADYEPDLGMTMSEFLTKYNAVSAPLDSPYIKLNFVSQWSVFNEYNVAWFYPVKNQSIILLLMSKDPDPSKGINSGLDMIQIVGSSSDDFIGSISLVLRCTDFFSAELFGITTNGLTVSNLIRYYYENNYKEEKKSAYWTLSSDSDLCIALCYDNEYFFQISNVDVFQ